MHDSRRERDPQTQTAQMKAQGTERNHDTKARVTVTAVMAAAKSFVHLRPLRQGMHVYIYAHINMHMRMRMCPDRMHSSQLPLGRRHEIAHRATTSWRTLRRSASPLIRRSNATLESKSTQLKRHMRIVHTMALAHARWQKMKALSMKLKLTSHLRAHGWAPLMLKTS